jgi:hypothetical protein
LGQRQRQNSTGDGAREHRSEREIRTAGATKVLHLSHKKDPLFSPDQSGADGEGTGFYRQTSTASGAIKVGKFSSQSSLLALRSNGATTYHHHILEVNSGKQGEL